MITKVAFNHQKNEWVNIDTDHLDVLKKIYKTYDIDEEIVAYSLDTRERARLDYDSSTNTFVLIYNVPNQGKIDNHYETIPITFLIKDSQLITVTHASNNYIVKKMQKYLEDNEETSLFQFLFSSLFMISDAFFPYVEEMEKNRKIINDKLKEKTTKQNLLSLSDLETGIVYFVAASKQNVVVLEQVKAHAIYRTLNETENERFEDAQIEAKQLAEMTQLSLQILQQLSGTYNNILNNNLNDTMRILTVLSILLTVPTIITGFFGMNVPLPLEHNALGWLTVIVISGVVWLFLSLILRRLMK